MYLVCIGDLLNKKIMDFDNNDEENFDEWDGALFDGLSEIEKLEKEEEVLNMAFNNSYDIITKSVTFEELLEKNHFDPYGEGYTTVAHDVESGPSLHDLQNIILYFQEKEEYEKCAVIHKMLPYVE